MSEFGRRLVKKEGDRFSAVDPGEVKRNFLFCHIENPSVFTDYVIRKIIEICRQFNRTRVVITSSPELSEETMGLMAHRLNEVKLEFMAVPGGQKGIELMHKYFNSCLDSLTSTWSCARLVLLGLVEKALHIQKIENQIILENKLLEKYQFVARLESLVADLNNGLGDGLGLFELAPGVKSLAHGVMLLAPDCHSGVIVTKSQHAEFAVNGVWNGVGTETSITFKNGSVPVKLVAQEGDWKLNHQPPLNYSAHDIQYVPMWDRAVKA